MTYLVKFFCLFLKKPAKFQLQKTLLVNKNTTTFIAVVLKDCDRER